MVFLHMCQRMNERKKILQRLIWVYQPMILRSNHASVELLMSLRDVWCQLNSVRPLFGSLVGHRDCPHWGASLQATLEVIAGLLELSGTQTSPRRHLPPTENAPRTHGLQYFFFQTPRFSTSQAVQSKNTYRWTVLTHWLLHLRVFYHFSRRYWPVSYTHLTLPTKRIV